MLIEAQIEIKPALEGWIVKILKVEAELEESYEMEAMLENKYAIEGRFFI